MIIQACLNGARRTDYHPQLSATAEADALDGPMRCGQKFTASFGLSGLGSLRTSRLSAFKPLLGEEETPARELATRSPAMGHRHI
jgi:hypothetical protein